MNKVAVIAKNMESYRRFLAKNKFFNEYFYVHDSNQLRGYKELNFVFLYGALTREDLSEIIQTLMQCNIGTKYENKVRSLNMRRLLYT